MTVPLRPPLRGCALVFPGTSLALSLRLAQRPVTVDETRPGIASETLFRKGVTSEVGGVKTTVEFKFRYTTTSSSSTFESPRNASREFRCPEFSSVLREIYFLTNGYTSYVRFLNFSLLFKCHTGKQVLESSYKRHYFRKTNCSFEFLPSTPRILFLKSSER